MDTRSRTSTSNTPDGHLERLKYLHAAAWGGHLDRLKYLHENGCAWDEWAYRAAAQGGHLECLKYLHENGWPLPEVLIKCPYQTAQAALDEVKNDIPDGNYKTIADALMHAHRAKRRRE